MSFLLDAANPPKGFRNFMDFGRQWLEEVGSPDCQGRVTWALGVAAAEDPFGFLQMPATYLLEQVVPYTQEWTEHPRARAYAMLGLAYVQSDKLNSIRRQFTEDLLALYDQNSCAHWDWFQDHLSYANALLPHALLLQNDHERAQEVGLRTLEWLFEHESEGEVMSFTGNVCAARFGEKPGYDQQPIEAQEMSSACRAAYNLTHDPVWIERQAKCLAWFHGANPVGFEMADARIGACADGLTCTGPSMNFGAESTIAYLITLQDRRDLVMPSVNDLLSERQARTMM